MKVNNTAADRFDMTDLSKADLYLMQEALIAYKQNVLKDPEEFRQERQRCVDLYSEIETAVIKSR